MMGCSSFLAFLNFLVIAFFSLQRFSLVSGLNYSDYGEDSSLRLERIRRHLNKINKRPLLTIESPDGDIIDCVDRRRQLALDHPLLQNHTIQRKPSEMPRSMWGLKENEERGGNFKRKENILQGAWQMWHRNGTRCPNGTVPIRRTTEHDVLRAKSLFDFDKKQPNFSLARQSNAPDLVSCNGHEHAIAYTGTSQELYGASATVNVWDPSIQAVTELSLSQIWILSGSIFDGSDLNSIEAGWQVNPELYGDGRPRLFTYWTSDSYQATGCYNLLCAGFIQTNSRIAIGGAISPVSSYGSNQYDINILIWKDPKLGNWWMRLGDTVVGYWPAELFTHLADHATMVEWGGEVVNSGANGEHTSTQMGSGHFAEDGFGKASYFRNLKIVNSDNRLSSAQDISILADNTNCYNIKSSYNNKWGTHFYYGGPGKNPRCA